MHDYRFHESRLIANSLVILRTWVENKIYSILLIRTTELQRYFESRSLLFRPSAIDLLTANENIIYYLFRFLNTCPISYKDKYSQFYGILIDYKDFTMKILKIAQTLTRQHQNWSVEREDHQTQTKFFNFKKYFHGFLAFQVIVQYNHLFIVFHALELILKSLFS